MKEESLLLLSDLQKLINQVVLIDYTIIILGGKSMNKYSLSIKWKFNEEFESWNMIIISDDSKEHVTEVIKNYQKTNNVEFESPVDLMDAICDEYGWQWEDFYYDIEIVSD